MAPDGPDNGNSQRVTNAQLRGDISYLRNDLASFANRIEKCIEEARAERRENARRIGSLETDVGRLDERLSTSNKILGTVQGIVAAAVAAVGFSVSK